jgi:RNA polymerase sigma factor (sigma-70 family)
VDHAASGATRRSWAGGLTMSADRRGSMVLDLFERYYERVYLFARRSQDAATAEDVTQEVFTRVLDLRDLEMKEISVSYLLKIADNLMKRRGQRTQRYGHVLEEHHRGATQHRGPRGSQPRSEEFDDRRAVSRCVAALGDREQEVVRMVVCGGMSYQQAASALGVRVTSVNNWKHRGIQRLRQHASIDASKRPSDRGRDASHRGGGFGQRAG